MSRKTFNLSAGVGLFAFILAEHFMGWDIGVYSSIATTGLLLATIIVTNYQGFRSGTQTDMREIFKNGLRASLTIGLFAAAGTVIVHKWLHPEFLEKIITETREVMTKEGQNEEAIANAIALKRKMFSPFVLSATTLFRVLFIGGLISLMTTAVFVVLKRKI
ncbi:MAG: DUF4199 domain-containing protein [Flavobacteriales bacterium]|nr:DUF4199 domain-containing protein [Flavobacteriales bacterium]MCB9448959.1 DUF4199 domain-containing protein [Flavobacteriales bacterium]